MLQAKNTKAKQIKEFITVEILHLMEGRTNQKTYYYMQIYYKERYIHGIAMQRNKITEKIKKISETAQVIRRKFINIS